ncbi:MAG: argininosuccinate lyase [Clostridia bacterium]|nr:argininosuccinate lyase [Clostridia bacterium]
MKLWGGRFSQKTNHLLETFNASITFDYKLFKEDIEGSIAHATMLEKIGVITSEELKLVIKGLKEVQEDIEGDTSILNIENEDIHMNVESLLTQKIGTLGKKIHTARSRNDQVAVDLKMYTKKKIQGILSLLEELLSTFLTISEQHMDYILPGYTHLQRAQPIRLSFHIMAYFQKIKRDYTRFEDVLERLDELPLGSGAMSGVSYETDRVLMKDLLGFSRISDNAMDAVSDRDYVIEFQSAASILMMHLSQISEEMILWSSYEFKFIEISDDFTTGSSIMPQKKNPDACELLRGKTGRVFGNLMGILTVMKGLPLAYNKDMQEDKEGLFDTVETLMISLQVLNEMLKTVKYNKKQMFDAVQYGFLNATDMADYLVYKGLPFRECHEIVGKITKDCIEQNIIFEEMTLEMFQKYSLLFDASIFETISIEQVIENKKSFGSTSKKSVLISIENGYDFLKIKKH